jgi:hypothetical protein
VNAEIRGFALGSFSSCGRTTPMRRTRSGCCAREVSGHAAALPSPAMNSRRRVCDLPRCSGSLSRSGLTGNRQVRPRLRWPPREPQRLAGAVGLPASPPARQNGLR